MQMQFHFQDGRPKQKRHRCRNPNKIDVNSLTGEERVQIINRRNARKVSDCVGDACACSSITGSLVHVIRSSFPSRSVEPLLLL